MRFRVVVNFISQITLINLDVWRAKVSSNQIKNRLKQQQQKITTTTTYIDPSVKQNHKLNKN